MKKIVVALLVLASCVARADIRPGFGPGPGPGPGGYGPDVNQRISELERVVYELNRRVTDLERSSRPNPYPPPPPVVRDITCMVTADFFNTVFLGKGRTRLDAEVTVLQNCAAGTNANSCKREKVICDDQQPRNYEGATCVITAKFFNTLFKAQGPSLIEAEYNVRKACQDKANPSSCNVDNQVRCETY
ncbi:MAG TPA: hypothetical protein VN132_05030 [Bdellovibrio sp.]|nr:hypothetical protein [Bdellovibrio sp.]